MYIKNLIIDTFQFQSTIDLIKRPIDNAAFAKRDI